MRFRRWRWTADLRPMHAESALVEASFHQVNLFSLRCRWYLHAAAEALGPYIIVCLETAGRSIGTLILPPSSSH